MSRKQQEEDKHRISKILWYLYCTFLVLSIVLIVRIVDIQYFWEPDPETLEYFQPKRTDKTIKPERGSIMDINGKLLAISTPMYDIHMDCAVLKDEFNAKMAEYTANLQALFAEGNALQAEIMEQLKKVKYE